MTEEMMQQAMMEQQGLDAIRAAYREQYPEHAKELDAAEEEQKKVLVAFQRAMTASNGEEVLHACSVVERLLRYVTMELLEQRRLFTRFAERYAPPMMIPAEKEKVAKDEPKTVLHSEGEAKRLRNHLARHRALVDTIDHDLADAHPSGVYNAQAVLESAGVIAISAAKLDAYRRAEGVGGPTPDFTFKYNPLRRK